MSDGIALRDLVPDVLVAVDGVTEPLVERDLIFSLKDLNRSLGQIDCPDSDANCVRLDSLVTQNSREAVVSGAVWRLLGMPGKPWTNIELSGIERQAHVMELNRLRVELLSCRIRSGVCS